jgi:hypothetical protein
MYKEVTSGKTENLSPEFHERLLKSVFGRVLGSETPEKTKILQENIANIQKEPRFHFAISKLNRAHEGLNVLLVYMQNTFPTLLTQSTDLKAINVFIDNPEYFS